MDIHFGPKVPNRVIRIRAGAKVLQIASDSIRDAVWKPVEDIHDDRFFDFSDLKIIPYYSECSLVAGASYYAIYKQPNQCRYIVLWEDSTYFGAFTLQGGSNSSLQSATSLAVCLAKHCFIVFKKVKRLAINDREDEICHTAPVKIFPQNVEAASQTVQDVLQFNAYDSGSNCDRVLIVALEGLCFAEEGTAAQLYPQLDEKFGKMPGDFEIGLTRKTFNAAILGGDPDMQLPSHVSVLAAYNVLRRQEDRKWKLLPEDLIPRADVNLQSLHVDVDSGIFSLSASPLATKTMQIALDSIKAVLSVEMRERCTTTYVPRGKQWRFCTKSEHKPTICQRGHYVRLPHPDHTNEPVKIWLHLPAATKLPDKFLDTIRQAFILVARTIVESETCQLKRSILLSSINMDSSSLSAAIPGGILLSVAAFVEISRFHPQVELVLETYNGKLRGLSAPVQIHHGVPQMLGTGDSLIQSCIRTENLFSIVSSLICNNLFKLVTGSSSIGFGFRATYSNQNDKNLVFASLNFEASDNTNVQLFPLAYLDNDICPNVTSWNASTTSATSAAESVCRSQFYLEHWSLQKASNTNSQWAYSSTGQNLKAAMNLSYNGGVCDSELCASVNTSVLRQGLPATCAKLDQSFRLFSEIGGSRFEIAAHPTLLPLAGGNVETHFAFNFQSSIQSCWKHIETNVRFHDNQSIVKFGVLNTAACLLGYRAALDELSVSAPGSDSQQELFCFMRYMNAILNSICNGSYVDGQNPKMFLSKYGLTAGRPLAIIPTIPLIVLERIRLWDSSCPIPTVEAPFKLSITEHNKQNRIEIRIAENTSMREMENCMICWTCKELFYGKFETRNRLLQDHLTANNHWAHSNTAVSNVDGQMWRNDFEQKRKAFELKLLEGNDDQHWAYKFAMNWTSLCMVGVPGSGKTWLIKNLGILLQCIFFKPGEVIWCSPLGRVAMHLHPDARTLHRILSIRSTGGSFPESLDQLTKHLKQMKPRPFSNLKIVLGTEMFMCTSPHLQSLLHFLETPLINKDAMVLFDGDPIQLGTRPNGEQHSAVPFLVKPEFSIACPGIQYVMFEKTMHFRIQDQVKLQHLKLMRNKKANNSTLEFFKLSRIQDSKPFLTLFATIKSAAKYNDQQFCLHLGQGKGRIAIFLPAEDFESTSKLPTTLSDCEEQYLPVESSIKVAAEVPIIVVQNCWGYPLGGASSTKIFIGNGAAGTFVRNEDEYIVVNLNLANDSGKSELFRIHRADFLVEKQNGTSCVRRQFPIMLAYATNIHKVQGMQFIQMRVNFELGKSTGNTEFYEGMAYMALSRANVVEIIGDITVALLNNVNSASLIWWNSQSASWTAFKSGTSLNLKYRNAVHESNLRLAALHKCYCIVASACDAVHVDIDIDDFHAPASAPAPAPAIARLAPGSITALTKEYVHTTATSASAPHNSLDSALTLAPAPPKKRRTNASDPAHSKQPGLPLAPAPAAAPVPAQKRQNTTDPASLSSNTSHAVRLQNATLPAVAAAQATAPAPALVTAPGLALDTDNVINPAPKAGAKSRTAFLSVIESDEEFELIVMSPSSTSSAMPTVRTAVAISLNPAQVGLLTASLPAFSSTPAPASLSMDDIENHLVVGLPHQTSDKMQRQPSKRVLVPAHVLSTVAPSKQPAPKLDSVTSATVTATTVPASAPRNTSVLRVVFEVDWTSVGRDDIGPAKLPGVKNDWLRMKLEDKVTRIEGLWTKSTTELGSYSFNWDKGVKLFSSDGFGEVTASFCLFMVEIHAKHTAFPIHQQTFIDIGSGLAKAVCQVATLQPNFSSCFGIELQADRCCHSTEITSSFAKKALRALVPFCRISLVQGDCLQNPILRHKLSRAGLIFINNEIFPIKMNQVKMTFALIPQTSNSHRTSSRF